MDKDKAKKIIKGTAVALGATYVVLDLVAKKQKADTTYKNEPDQQNPMQGKSVEFVADSNDPENADGECGHLEATGESHALTRHQSAYEKVVKRGLDKGLSFAGLVVLSPLMLGISAAIKIEDPGPVLFTQKRVGQDKAYFKLHKFRSMKMSTPHDVPTHMLENPEQYITKVGGFIRKHSLDELPQIWDIFVGNMSVIGPRPALWNQDVLVAERDKVGANDVKPGLTGWAQINGRDELSLADKSALDGVYTQALEAGGTTALKMDLKCFTGSLHVFGSDDTVVEGGTGEMEREKSYSVDPSIDPSDDHFSVLMSVYAKENSEYFDLALNSILVDQTKTPDEFILVCDGPLTPELDAVITRYEDQFSSILKVHRLSQNGGLGNALNEGLPLCSYDLVARADSDDICAPDRFEKQVAFMQANPDIGIISSYIDEFDTDWNAPKNTKTLPLTNAELVKMAKFRNPINHMAAMYRKHLILSIGSYRQIQYVEDYDLWIRAIAHGIKFANIDEVLVHARVGNGMLDRRGSKSYINSWKVLCDYMLQKGMINHVEYVRNMAAIRAFVYTPGGYGA